ncbi:hypothetical protein QQG55_33695 [Brugia pahangi]
MSSDCLLINAYQSMHSEKNVLCYTYGNVRSKFVKNLSNLQIQRHHIKYLNDQLSIQPQNSFQNSSNSCTTERIRHQFHRDRLSLERKKFPQVAC